MPYCLYIQQKKALFPDSLLLRTSGVKNQGKWGITNERTYLKGTGTN